MSLKWEELITEIKSLDLKTPEGAARIQEVIVELGDTMLPPRHFMAVADTLVILGGLLKEQVLAVSIGRKPIIDEATDNTQCYLNVLYDLLSEDQ